MISDDRPFCGWTHLDLAQRFYLTHAQRPARLHVQLDLGVVGPLSLAAETQAWWHEKRRQVSARPELDPDPSRGWKQQYAKSGFPGCVQLTINYGIALYRLRKGEKLGVELVEVKKVFPVWDIGLFKDIIPNRGNFLKLKEKKYIRYEDLPLKAADGRKISVEFVSNVYREDHHDVIQCNIRDITEKEKLLEASQRNQKLESLVVLKMMNIVFYIKVGVI